jgi:hypothetical protein
MSDMEVNMSQDLLITLVPYIVPVIIIFATSIAQATGKVPTVASRFIEDSPQVKVSKQHQNITAQNER